MTNVMCAQKLWQVVRHWDVKEEPVGVSTEGLLGSWAADRFTDADADVVIAVSDVTYLTVVFPLPSCVEFRPMLRDALRAALHDLGVVEAHIAAELAALRDLSVQWLRQPAFRRYLSDLDMFCGIELPYHDDLRVVQRNLNDVPFAPIPEHVPALAVKALFSPGGRRPHRVAH